jgi:hypothetical protein
MTRRRSTLIASAILLLLLAGMGWVTNLRPGTTEPAHAEVWGQGSLVIGSDSRSGATRAGTKHSERGLSVAVMSRHLLYPGTAAPLDLVFANRRAFDVKVVKVQVRTEGADNCPARYYRVGSYQLRHPVLVPGHDFATSQVPFGLRGAAPDVCQAARISVDVTATAVKQ